MGEAYTDGVRHLREWIEAHADLQNTADLKAVGCFNELLESSSILAAELDTIYLGGEEKDEGEAELLAKCLEVGRAAAEVEPLPAKTKGTKLVRSMEFWMKKAKQEGESAVTAGTPDGVGNTIVPDEQ